MIMSLEGLKKIEQLNGIDNETLLRKVNAIEIAIRGHTNNNFQNRNIRFEASADNGALNGSSPLLKIGDTVQISQSINDGLYDVKSIDKITKLDRALFDSDFNRVTKIEYPPDVQEGVINMLLWDFDRKGRVGVKSENISRYTVTYFGSTNAADYVIGYPATIMGFLKPYMRAQR